MTDPRTEYYNGFLDAMFAVRDLVEEWLPHDPDSFGLEFWALCEEVTNERGPTS